MKTALLLMVTRQEGILEASQNRQVCLDDGEGTLVSRVCHTVYFIAQEARLREVLPGSVSHGKVVSGTNTIAHQVLWTR